MQNGLRKYNQTYISYIIKDIGFAFRHIKFISFAIFNAMLLVLTNEAETD